MENLQQYPPEKRAQMFLTEFKDKCLKAADGDAVAGAELIGLLFEQYPDLPPMVDEIGEEARRYFTPRQKAAVETAKLFIGKFNNNFGWDSDVWEVGLNAETLELKRFIGTTAKLTLGILEPKGRYGKEEVSYLIDAHTYFEDLVTWANLQLTKQGWAPDSLG